MEITILQAVLIGLFYWLAQSIAPYGSIAFSPLPCAVWAGLVMGDVTQGVMIGASIQLIYLGMIYAGGQVASDETAATLIAVPIIIQSGMPIQSAVAVAIPVGVLMGQLQNVQQIVMTGVAHLADRYAEKGDTRKIYLCAFLYPQLVRIVLRFIPLSLAVYLGSPFVKHVLTIIPDFIMNGLTVAGSIMPAVGFGIVAFVIGQPILLPFFVIGFFLVKYTGVSTIGAAIAGGFIAFLFYLFTVKYVKQEPEEQEEEIPVVSHSLLTKRDVRKSFILWNIFAATSQNYERQMGMSFCASFIPCLKKMYKDNTEGLKDALKRHLEFYNTEATLGSTISGIALAMEEQRAMGNPVEGEMITGVKTGLMGPFAGIGDSIIWGTMQPLLTGLFLAGAAKGSVISALAPWTIFIIIQIIVSYRTWMTGYNLGAKSATKLLGSGGFKKLITTVSVFGLFMMGALAAGFISVQIPFAVTTKAGEFAVQKILDGLAPGLVPLAILAGTYLFTRKYKSFLKTAVMVLAVGLVLGSLGVLAVIS